jgi:hypothetical protein
MFNRYPDRTKPKIIEFLPGYEILNNGLALCQSECTKVVHRASVGTADRPHSSYHHQSQIRPSRYRSQSVALANRDNLALMILLDLEPDFGFIERIPPLGKLFFAISGLSDSHRAYLAATSDTTIIAWVKGRSPPC